MRTFLLIALLFAAPGLALAANPKLKSCKRPTQCHALGKLAAQCKKGMNCGSFVVAAKKSVETNSCRYDSRDSDYQRCSRQQRYITFDALAHAKGTSAKKLFCGAAFRKAIGRDTALGEDYDYAYVRLEPSDMKELTDAEVKYYQTMIDCRTDRDKRD
jgi:hypothetical protein